MLVAAPCQTSGYSVRRNESWCLFLDEKAPGTAWGCCREQHQWAWYHGAGHAGAAWGFTSCLKVPLSLLCVLHLTIVQKCDLQVWKLNVPLKFSINLSPVHMGTRWADLVVWDAVQALKSVFPAGTKNESLAFLGCYLRREFCHGCTRWLRGQEGGFGMDSHLKPWANLILPRQLAHFRNQLSQRGFLFLLSN